MAGLIQSIERDLKNWWLLLIVGIIFIAAGITTFLYPAASYLTLAVFFGMAILFGGVFKIAFAISNRKSITGWGWTLTSGIVDVIIGSLLFSNPALSLIVLPFIVGFYILYAGGILVSLGIDGKSLQITGAGWIVFGGIITLLLGLGILFFPAAGIVVLITITGASFLAEGITYCVVAFKLQKANRTFDHLHKKTHSFG